MFGTRNKIFDDAFFPMLVKERPDMTNEEVLRVWDVFDRLPEDRKNALISNEMAWKVAEIAERYSLSREMVMVVSLAIRKLYLGESDAAGAEAKIASSLALTNADPAQAKAIVETLIREVLPLRAAPPTTREVTMEPTPRKGTVKMLLLRALGEYPNLGQQMLSAERIKLRNQPEPVRPTLSNWIHYYRDELGIGFHDEVKRGQFLFKSENGLKLSAEERERLNLVLKSIEEEFPLEIDTDRQMVLFPKLSPASSTLPTEKRPPAMPKPQSTFGKTIIGEFGYQGRKNVANDTLHFSTGHVMPAEKTGSVPVSPPASLSKRETIISPSPVAATPRKTIPNLPPNPYFIRPLRSNGEK